MDEVLLFGSSEPLSNATHTILSGMCRAWMEYRLRFVWRMGVFRCASMRQACPYRLKPSGRPMVVGSTIGLSWTDRLPFGRRRRTVRPEESSVGKGGASRGRYRGSPD